MQILKKVLLGLGVGIALCSNAFADVTVLDNQNASQCQRQIASAKQRTVVVAAYESECPWWQKLQPTFDSVASSGNYPAAYFTFDFSSAAPGVAANCLRYDPRFCPTTLVYNKSKRGYSLVRSKVGYISEGTLVGLIQGR